MTTNMRDCQHCGLPYDWRRSPSGFLKMTYCGSLCEKADLGFTIETLLGQVQVVRLDWKQLLAARGSGRSSSLQRKICVCRTS